MRNYSAVFAISSFLIAGIAIQPALHAHDSLNRHTPKTNSEERVKPGGMSGMMNMMRGKGRTMRGCKQMMETMMDGKVALKPNEQWRTKPPVTTKKDG